DFVVRGELLFMTCNDRMCLPPEYIDIEFKLAGAQNPLKKEELDIDYTDTARPADTDTTTTVADYEPVSSGGNRSLLGVFVLSFLGALAALLTPCVFPMIPLTVSFFTKQSKTRSRGIFNALIYGASIVVLYTTLGYLI